MQIGSIREAETGEHRVALTPTVSASLIKLGLDVVVETAAGSAAGFTDDAYRDAGVAVVDRSAALASDIVAVVGPLPAVDLAFLGSGSALVGLLEPHAATEALASMASADVSGFALEILPRTTLAQSMDALSSQATVAGYEAVLLAASKSTGLFPMLMTAAGTIPPAKVLVLGVGVAGLQAIATAKRLGAVVFAYDIRPETREQVESLGGRFVGGPTMDQGSTGYAGEVDADLQVRQLQALEAQVAVSDVIITTARVPGRTAPRLVTAAMVESMSPGSVIIDMAADSGGNCELSAPDETVVHRGVSIYGPTDLAARAAADASSMYARNIASFVERLVVDGELSIDLDDEIVGGSCVVHRGQVRYPKPPPVTEDPAPESTDEPSPTKETA